MASTIRRYSATSIIGLNSFYGTSYTIPIVRNNIALGNIKTKEIIMKEGMRLDVLAGIEYGDGRLYWLISIASNIGWSGAVIPGTVIKVPDINDVIKFIG
jgi:hypothetical protein